VGDPRFIEVYWLNVTISNQYPDFSPFIYG